MFEELLILGFGGHARSLADVALTCGYSQLVFFDKNAGHEEMFLDFPVVNHLAIKSWRCALGAGDNARREIQFQEACQMQWSVERLISPHATKGVGSEIGIGSLLAHHAHVGPMTKVGKACIINTGAIVEHDCCIGDFSHVSINATLAGHVVLGHHVFIGAGAVIRNGIKVTNWVTIGAGATVVKDITIPGTYVGTPAKLMDLVKS